MDDIALTSSPKSTPGAGVAIAARAYRYIAASWASLAVAFGILCLWQIAVSMLAVPEAVLPTPLTILGTIVRVAPVLVSQAAPTILDVILGFAFAVLSGIVLAVALVYSRGLRQALYPSILFFQLIPKIALAPLFVLWFGIGSGSRLAYIIFIAFFPVLLAALTGLLSTPPEMLRLCRAYNSRATDVLLSVRFPYAMPMIFNGLKISVTFAIVGVVVGEFISAQAGLGYLILFATSQADTPLAMAAISAICAIGLALYGFIVATEAVIMTRLGERSERVR